MRIRRSIAARRVGLKSSLRPRHNVSRNSASPSESHRWRYTAMKAPFLIGRMMFGGFFLYNGINHFLKERDYAQYAGAKHVPIPDVAVQVSGAMLAIGGASILL